MMGDEAQHTAALLYLADMHGAIEDLIEAYSQTKGCILACKRAAKLVDLQRSVIHSRDVVVRTRDILKRVYPLYFFSDRMIEEKIGDMIRECTDAKKALEEVVAAKAHNNPLQAKTAA